MQEAVFADGFVGKHRHKNHEGDRQSGKRTDKFSQLYKRHTPYEHHRENRGKENGGRREILGKNKSAHRQQYEQYHLESPAIGTVFALHFGKDKGYGYDYHALGHLGGLEVDATRQGKPARALVLGHTDEGCDEKQYEAEGPEKYGDYLEIAAGNGMEEPHDRRSRTEEKELLEERFHEIAALVGQCTGSAEHFDDRNHAEEEEHHPDDRVALKDTAGRYIQFRHRFSIYCS